MRHRPGWGWFVLVMVIVAIAACVVVIMMALMRPVGAAEMVRLKPGELELMAKVVAAESTGEPEVGQRAVAWTILNRLDEPETFGRTVTKVLLSASQFARPAALPDTSPAYWRAMLATVRVLLGDGDDPSLGSTHFFRTDMKPWPHWAKHMQVRATIGKHTFMAPVD
jgi:N-acetylmuramoyl-L-alanine amidase